MDINAATKPSNSNVGLFHDDAPMPSAIGINDISVAVDGKADMPSNAIVNSTVIIGMAHLLVYVNDIPILSNAILLL